jgi:hypothetical protein
MQSHYDILTLPRVIWTEIFKFFKWDELMNASLTCKTIYAATHHPQLFNNPIFQDLHWQTQKCNWKKFQIAPFTRHLFDPIQVDLATDIKNYTIIFNGKVSFKDGPHYQSLNILDKSNEYRTITITDNSQILKVSQLRATLFAIRTNKYLHVYDRECAPAHRYALTPKKE